MIEILEQAAHALWQKKNYQDAAAILRIATKYCADDRTLDALYSNARMCYFLANDVPNAYELLVAQEQLGINTSWELQRDKANYLRYLDGHDQAYEIVKNLLPDNSTKYLALSWFLHKQGKFREAFAQAEQGRHNNYWWGKRPPLNYDIWDGKPCDTIVIVGESGSGDEIIFARWIPEVISRATNVYYYTDSDLSDVFIRIYGVKKYTSEISQNAVMIPCMSIPYILEKQDPTPLRYLTSNSDYDPKLAEDKPKIGLCFHGDPTHHETTLRTLPQSLIIEKFSDLGILINLQKDPKRVHSQLKYLSLETWEHTLAVIDSCDLIVTCDTSISHAAGALGKPMILLMHAAAYFTWNHNEPIGRSDWYENAWCVKQTEPCRWEGCIDLSRDLAQKILHGEINDTRT